MENQKTAVLIFAVCPLIALVTGEDFFTGTTWSKVDNDLVNFISCDLASQHFARSVLQSVVLCASNQQCPVFCYATNTSTCHVCDACNVTSFSGDAVPTNIGQCYVKDHCPHSEGYARYSGSYNRCIKLYQEAASFQDANDRCLQDGGHLYYVTSIQDMQALRLYTAYGNIWMGATDLQTEGTFLWSDGTSVLSLLWAANEPNGGYEENCVVLSGPGLNDIDCSRIYPFVCHVDDLFE